MLKLIISPTSIRKYFTSENNCPKLLYTFYSVSKTEAPWDFCFSLMTRKYEEENIFTTPFEHANNDSNQVFPTCIDSISVGFSCVISHTISSDEINIRIFA